MIKGLNIKLDNGGEVISHSDRSDIIKIYAIRIDKLWTYYKKKINNIKINFLNKKISYEAKNIAAQKLSNEINLVFSNLMIEQYYNTGDFELFDRAIQFNENIELKNHSLINLNELDNYDDYETDLFNMTIFYKGVFINLKNFKKSAPSHLKLIVRDPETVTMINQKIDRSRRILEIDDVSLGKKIYDGLCLRSHYWHSR